MGGIDVLINNAAFTSELAKKNNIKFEDFDMKTWEHSIKINLTSVFSCKIVIPHMIKNKYDKIINISSLYGHLSPCRTYMIMKILIVCPHTLPQNLVSLASLDGWQQNIPQMV